MMICKESSVEIILWFCVIEQLLSIFYAYSTQWTLGWNLQNHSIYKLPSQLKKNEFELTLSIIGGGFEWINWWKREFIVDSWLEKLHDFLMNGGLFRRSTGVSGVRVQLCRSSLCSLAENAFWLMVDKSSAFFAKLQ